MTGVARCRVTYIPKRTEVASAQLNELSRGDTPANQYPQDAEHDQLSRSLPRDLSQVTALPSPSMTNILTSELGLLVFELYRNGIIQKVLFYVRLFHYVCKIRIYFFMWL